MSRIRPGIPPATVQHRVEDFIDSAPGKGVDLPWRNARVRDDVAMQLNSKVTEPLFLKFEWLANRRGLSKRRALEEALTAWADAQLKRIGVSDE